MIFLEKIRVWRMGLMLVGCVVLVSAQARAQNYAGRVQQARTAVNPGQVQGKKVYTTHPLAPGSNTPAHTQTLGTQPVYTQPRAGIAAGSNRAGAMGMAGPLAASIGAGTTGAYPTQPRPVATNASMAGLRQAITHFYMDMGRFPTAAEGLNALIRRPPGAQNWKGPYVTVTNGRPPFTDPWGNLYRLINTSYPGVQYQSFMIKSNGPDGLPDTADDLSVTVG